MEKKNHGDPPNRNLVLGRQTNLLPYSHNLEAELGLLIAGAGVLLSNLKDMDAAERSTHAAKCACDRSIGAKTLDARQPRGEDGVRERGKHEAQAPRVDLQLVHLVRILLHSGCIPELSLDSFGSHFI